MKVEVAVLTPVTCDTVFVVFSSDTTEVADYNGPDTPLFALRNDVFRECMQEVASTLSLFPVESARFA